MGVSTNGIVFWGFVLDELPEDAKLGDFTYVRDGEAWKVTAGVHCSESEPMLYVALTESLQIARRGYPERLSRFTFDRPWPVWPLGAYCNENGFLLPQRLGAWLCSYWDE